MSDKAGDPTGEAGQLHFLIGTDHRVVVKLAHAHVSEESYGDGLFFMSRCANLPLLYRLKAVRVKREQLI